jgi:hypothetical protein
VRRAAHLPIQPTPIILSCHQDSLRLGRLQQEQRLQAQRTTRTELDGDFMSAARHPAAACETGLAEARGARGASRGSAPRPTTTLL